MSDTYKSFVYGSEITAAIGGVSQLATDLATLVADGDSPTQAHATAVANDWCALTGGSSSGTASITQAAVLVNVDTTVITTVSLLSAVLRNIEKQALASGMAP